MAIRPMLRKEGMAMTDKIREVLNILDQENISYEILEHPPVYTIGEVLDAGLPKEEVIAKNLFVRDDRKDQYMLLVVPGDRRVNLKAFRRAMGTRPLSFASGEELSRILGLSKGAVSPLGVLNDRKRQVRVFVDQVFAGWRIGVHPNDNTATIWLATADLVALLEKHGSRVQMISFPE